MMSASKRRVTKLLADFRAEEQDGDAPVLSLEELRESLDREGPTGEVPGGETSAGQTRPDDALLSAEEAELFVLLDEALDRLEEEHPRAARGVECRFFGGMTIEETAEALGVSTATVSRDWTQAKAWLYREMKKLRSESEEV